MIYIGICTRERPQMLAALLESIAVSRETAQAEIEILLMENGPAAGAKAIAESFNPRLTIHYGTEPRLGIVYARNAVVDMFLALKGERLILLDDDNVVPPEWLKLMLKAKDDFPDADVIFGPTRYTYEADAPALLRKAVVTRLPYGARANTISTNNCLLRPSLFSDETGQHRFDEAFNLTGGEDIEFFIRRRPAAREQRFIGIAFVNEHVPASRQSFGYNFRKWRHQAHCFGMITIRHSGPVLGRLRILHHTSVDLIRFIALALAGAVVIVPSEQRGLRLWRRAFRNLTAVLGRPRALWRMPDGFYQNVQGK